MSVWPGHQPSHSAQAELLEPGTDPIMSAAQAESGGIRSHPIFDSIKSGMLIPVQTIVEQMGPDVLSVRDEKGHTPAHWTCLGGHTTILRYLLEHKAPVDEPSNNELGARPIHWACVNGHIAIVDILVQAGVNLDVMDNKGCTPLIVSAQYGQTMLAGYLMGKGARLQMVDKDGDNALHWAAFKELLLAEGEALREMSFADPPIFVGYLRARYHASHLCNNKICVNTFTLYLKPAIIIACGGHVFGLERATAISTKKGNRLQDASWIIEITS